MSSSKGLAHIPYSLARAPLSFLFLSPVALALWLAFTREAVANASAGTLVIFGVIFVMTLWICVAPLARVVAFTGTGLQWTAALLISLILWKSFKLSDETMKYAGAVLLSIAVPVALSWVSCHRCGRVMAMQLVNYRDEVRKTYSLNEKNETVMTSVARRTCLRVCSYCGYADKPTSDKVPPKIASKGELIFYVIFVALPVAIYKLIRRIRGRLRPVW